MNIIYQAFWVADNSEIMIFFIRHKSNSTKVSNAFILTGNTLEKTCGICNNGMPFSTYDRDNDNAANHLSWGNCADWAKGGWWHNSCQNSNLNGRYGDNGYGQGVNWEDWKTLDYSLKSSVMKVRKT